MSEAEETNGAPDSPPAWKFWLDFGPLLVFFIVTLKWGILSGTGVLMVGMLITLPITWRLEGKVPKMPLVTTILVLGLGGLTLWLEDERYIKIKPTVIYVLFAAILGGGLLFGRALFKPLLGSALKLEDEGWRKLTLRWAVFFLALAGLNELVWRNFTTNQWATFKVFGTTILSLVFLVAQLGLIQRYQIPEPDEAGQGGD